jgi:glycosyltransferase involved in cell wall biosynthesis
MVTPYFPPEGGGLERYATSIAEGLVGDYGWRVVFVTSGPRGSPASITEDDGFRVHRLPAQLTVSRTPLSLAWPLRIHAIARHERAVLVNAHAPVPGPADAAAVMPGARPFVLTYHTGPMHKGQPLADGAIWLYEHTVMRHTARQSEAVICSSAYVADTFAGPFSGKSVVIPPGVDAAAFRPGGLGRPGAVLFVAHLDPGMEFKGLGTLLAATRAAVDAGVEMTVEVVGSGQLLPSYEKQAADLGLGPERVRFSGHLAGPDLLAAYHRSSVAVLPSGNDSSPMFLAEAMACGLPVVASRTGGIPDVVVDGETSLLVTHGDVGELVGALSTVIDDPALAARLGAAGRRRAESEFAWGPRARATNDVFERVLQWRPGLRTNPDSSNGSARGRGASGHRGRFAVSEPGGRVGEAGTGSEPVLPAPSSMRVTQVTSRYPPDLGGMERAVQELSTVLVGDLGIQVEVVTGGRVGSQSTEPESPFRVRRLRSFDVEVTPVIPGLAWELLRRPRPDLFHMHVAHASTPETVALVSRVRDVPYVAHVHIDASPTTWMGFLLDGYQRNVLARVLARAALVLVPTDGYRTLVVDKYRLDPDRVRVLPYGTNMETRAADDVVSPSPDGPLRVVTVGRLAVEKNVSLVVDSVAALVDRDRLDVQLEIVGEGPTRSEVAERIAQHGLESRVRMVGRLDGSALVAAYDRSDLFVMTSLSESFGIVLIEAMARGVPVIAPDIAGVRDVVIDGVTGLLVDHTVDSVRAAVLRVVNDAALRKHLVDGARSHVTQYRWPEIACRCAALYEEVLSS